ncbi:MAG: hypothetical protein LIO93_01155, partial [Bacteroidales bacterium]|nr:hypothetical protein [Bacteroidales bacterium]
VTHFAVPAALNVQAWIKVPNLTGTKTIVCWKDVVNDGNAVLFRLYNDKLQFGEWIGNWKEINSSVSIRANEWTHVAVTRKGTNAKCYVNGVLAGTSDAMSNTPQAKTDRLTLGAITINASESFVGTLNEIRIWNAERTAEEIAAHYLVGLKGDESGLIGYWPLNGDANDKSSSGRNGTVTGSAMYVDRFTTELPLLNSVVFFENANTTPYIEVSGNQSGNVFWAVTKEDVSSLTPSEILGKDSRVIASGNGIYSSPNSVGRLGFSRTLTVGSSYKIHAVIVNKEGRLSATKTSSAFVYQGLSALPLGWHSTDVGEIGQPGTTTYKDNTFTVKGSGTGIQGTADQFHIVYQEYKGDVEITAEVVSTTGSNTTAAVMIRETLNADARYILAGITGDNIFSNRRSSGKSTTSYLAEEKDAAGWLKVIRKGEFVASYYSKDGTTWTEIYFPQSVGLNESVFVGLAVSSNDNNILAEAVFRNVTVKAPGEEVYLSDRGVYFYKKKYIPEPIPTYAANKHLLPVPVIDDHKEWLAMYDKTWQIAFTNMKAPPAGSPLVANWYDEALDGNIFQWDMIFMAMFGRYAHHIFPGVQSLDNFYARQKISGSIARVYNEKTGVENAQDDSPNLINPPIFSWAEVENYKVTGDKSRFEHILPVLEKYFEFVEKARCGTDTPHKLYWSNGQASGMDNTPRDTGRPNAHHSADHQGWVDMSSQMVIQCNNLATICEELGYTEKAEKYRTKANEIAERINQWLWNEEEGIYYDVNVQGKHTNWKTAACFWPMLAGITTPEQDNKLEEHLRNPDEFWREMIFPSLAASHPEYKSNGGYWRGAAWAPTNYAIIKGLEMVGKNAFAAEAAEKYVQGIYEVFLETGTLWENYAPDRVDGKLNPGVHDYSEEYFCRKDFVGWTGLGPISLLIENILGFRPNGAEKILTYYLQRSDRHGIQNLRMADITTSILTEDRKNDLSKAVVTVESDKPYKLIIHFNGTIRTFEVKEGTNKFTLEEGTALEEVVNPENFRLLANPVESELSFELNLSKPQKVDVSINDLQGSKIADYSEYMQQGVSRKVLSVEDLSQSVYLLAVATDEERFVAKWIKK